MGYVEALRKLVGHRPLIFVGAVVIIVDEQGRLLLQQRRVPYGKWGLPGGLMELGESTEETARREVFEETNLKVGKLHLINVYSGANQFIKAENGDEFYVVTIAYYTNEVHGELIADKEEAIQFRYVTPEEIPDDMVKSHRRMLNDFFKMKNT
ncbi:NUDIX hydrolase [Bacillus horti]|uniref:ADP-ribose pyrophosphatase YjhB (NUDIX family) n=1 Tax=Caldalkalibacillus horti TaxID=77523 RepID=A0ABT9VY32_9BACI|nr:NUDIX hydrolase [Bacillus horti]MDQ0165785.1 ADP-ribose pyrophosphatase YjhB (NUDIX family) [Bacillus horti]